MTKSSLTLLIIGLTKLISFGQESPTTESQPKAEPEALAPGDHTRTVLFGEQKRTYLFHVLKDYVPKKPAPVCWRCTEWRWMSR